MAEALILARLVHFAAVMAVFGAAAFRAYGLADAAGVDSRVALAAFERWLKRLVGSAALAALASAVLIVPCVAAGMAGSAGAMLDPATYRAVLFDTGFGRSWCWHLLLAVLLALTAGMRERRGAVAVLPLAGLTLASLAFVGHAADGSGWAGLGRELNQAVHLLAGGLWLGGLLPLAWLLCRAARSGHDEVAALVHEAVPHFSRMGYAAVAIIAITGAVNTAILVADAGRMLETGYGRLLAAKIALFLAMVLIAAINRFRLAPRLARATATSRPITLLYCSVLIEQAFGLAILAAVSVLGTWPPPR